MDPALKEKIAELIGMSVRRVSDVKRYLEQYVKNELFKGMALPPKTRRRYFPRKKDIANEIAKIKREKRFTHIDQDYLHHLISSWKVQKPDDMFFSDLILRRTTLTKPKTLNLVLRLTMTILKMTLMLFKPHVRLHKTTICYFVTSPKNNGAYFQDMETCAS